MRRPIRVVLTCLAAAATLLADSAGSLACTRVVYLGNNDDVITARSMDWKLDVATNLYILPRGIARTGESGPNSIKWTAKYGSVVATGYDVSTTDGMNEKGLAAELLWLVESQYPPSTRTRNRGSPSPHGRSTCWTILRPSRKPWLRSRKSRSRS